MVRENLEAVQGIIEDACERAGRPGDGVTLIAVSKTKPLELVREHWEREINGYDHSSEMGHTLWEIRDKELYSKEQLAQPPAAKHKKSTRRKGRYAYER